MTDLKDIVNTATMVSDILKANEVLTMPSLATALPRGIDPIATDPTWSSDPALMMVALKFPFANPAPDFLRPPNDELKFGVRWNYGGQVGGHGRFIKDAEAFVIVKHINVTVIYDIAVKFGETGTPIAAPDPDEPLAMLVGSITLRVSQTLGGVLFTMYYGVRIFGNGAGDITRIE